ncbi:energy transducer TonB [Plastorhodobacter daqingensis]|uniref:Energy transducer TonB n=1 Tax=Plastorhodobacter daqingensis TaxID=1387281 RepID=A0ABW2ULJ5_9RHOB
MKRGVEAFLALVAAVLIHLAFFAGGEPAAGAVSAGAGGDALVSVEASSASISELVAEWERPPKPAEPETAPPEIAPPPPPPPAMPVPAEAPRAPVAPTVPLPTVPDLPDIQLADLPPPPPEPEPEPAPAEETPEPEPAPEPADETSEAVAEIPDVRPQPRPERPQRAVREQPRQPAQNRAPAPPPPSAASAGQVAAGAGGGPDAGDRGAAEAATRAAAQSAQAAWGAAIRSRIERRISYPRGSNASGTVHLTLQVSRDGSLLAVRVTQSSGHPELDAAALSAVQSAGRFPAAPAELTESSYLMPFPVRMSRR